MPLVLVKAKSVKCSPHLEVAVWPCDVRRFLIKTLINFVFMFSSALQSIFISRITEGGAADRIGVLLVGDKVMEVSESR